MHLTFPEPSNVDIDRLVRLSQSTMSSHTSDTIYVPVDRIVEDDEEGAWQHDEEPVDLEGPITATPFSPVVRMDPLPLIAVDSGVAELGRLSGGGCAVAVRAAAVVHQGTDRATVLLYDTGGMVIDEGSRIPLFHHIGCRLSDPDLWVETASGLPLATDKTPTRMNEIKSACRSFIERIVTEDAIGILANCGGGTLLLDGALPPQSFDLPFQYVRSMLDGCAKCSVDVIAISKKTRHTVNNRPIEALFDDDPLFLGYAPIRALIDSLRARHAGQGAWRDISAAAEVYAARFGIGPTALTFRVDVHNSFASTPSEVIERIFTDIHLYGGYPYALIEAHQHSSFFGMDTYALVADLAVRYGLRIEPEKSMEVLFQPFNAFGK